MLCIVNISVMHKFQTCVRGAERTLRYVHSFTLVLNQNLIQAHMVKVNIGTHIFFIQKMNDVSNIKQTSLGLVLQTRIFRTRFLMQYLLARCSGKTSKYWSDLPGNWVESPLQCNILSVSQKKKSQRPSS